MSSDDFCKLLLLTQDTLFNSKDIFLRVLAHKWFWTEVLTNRKCQEHKPINLIHTIELRKLVIAGFCHTRWSSWIQDTNKKWKVTTKFVNEEKNCLWKAISSQPGENETHNSRWNWKTELQVQNYHISPSVWDTAETMALRVPNWIKKAFRWLFRIITLQAFWKTPSPNESMKYLSESRIFI